MKTRKKRNILWTTPRDEFIHIVSSLADRTKILLHYGLNTKGSHYATLNRRLAYEGIDTMILDINGSLNRRIIKNPIYTDEEIFVENSLFNRGSIKRRILNKKLIEYKCAICGMLDSWNHQKLVLVLDHINGVHNDHRLENLRFLCPNCNSQQPTFAGRNKKYKN